MSSKSTAASTEKTAKVGNPAGADTLVAGTAIFQRQEAKGSKEQEPTTPALSLASADRRDSTAETAPPSSPRLMRNRAPSGWALEMEAARVALKTAHMPLLLALREGWLYRQTFRGPVPNRILFYPGDTRVRRLEDADGFIRGRFRLGGQNSKFGKARFSIRYCLATPLLRRCTDSILVAPSRSGGGELARAFALKLTQQWLKRYARFTQEPGARKRSPNASSICSPTDESPSSILGSRLALEAVRLIARASTDAFTHRR